jgi:hypothetical protein
VELLQMEFVEQSWKNRSGAVPNIPKCTASKSY